MMSNNDISNCERDCKTTGMPAAEIVGATTTSGRIPSYLMPFATGTGYADTSNDIFNNIMKNICTSIATRGIQNIPNVPQFYRNLGQNALSWSLLDKENQ